MNITEEQKKLIEQYIDDPSGDIDSLLLQLDEIITKIGFDDDYNLTEEGLKLQRLYDEIYNQN